MIPYGKYKYLFGTEVNDYKYDDVSLYSITPHKYSKLILKIMRNTLQKKLCRLIITDACACIGNDTINFCKYFAKVNAVEIDKKRFQYLKHNLSLHKFRNYKLYNKDYITIMEHLKQDVIYLDFPWGGQQYKNFDICNPLLNSTYSIADICIKLKNKCKFFYAKVPHNFNMEEFDKITNPHFSSQCFKNDKFNILFLKKNILV